MYRNDPIVNAIDTNNHELARFLLKTETDINRYVYYDQNMLQYVLIGCTRRLSLNKLKFVLMFLSFGIDVDGCDSNGVSARVLLASIHYFVDRKYLIHKPPSEFAGYYSSSSDDGDNLALEKCVGLDLESIAVNN